MGYTPLPRPNSCVPSVFWSQFPYLRGVGGWPGGISTGSLASAPGVPNGLAALMLHLSSNSLWAALEGSWLGKPIGSVGQPAAGPGSGLLVILSGLPPHGIATLSFLLSKQASLLEGKYVLEGLPRAL